MSDKIHIAVLAGTTRAQRKSIHAARFVGQIGTTIEGITVALYTYIRRHQQAVVVRKGLGGFFVALIGSGCIACGTSILSPLLVGVGAGASALIGATAGTIGYLIGIILMAYSIYVFSMRANYELIKLQ